MVAAIGRSDRLVTLNAMRVGSPSMISGASGTAETSNVALSTVYRSASTTPLHNCPTTTTAATLQSFIRAPLHFELKQSIRDPASRDRIVAVESFPRKTIPNRPGLAGQHSINDSC